MVGTTLEPPECWNGKIILHWRETPVIQSDASLHWPPGLGAVCNGFRMGGP